MAMPKYSMALGMVKVYWPGWFTKFIRCAMYC